jgi:cobalt-zinc-cadmium efflux system outer membrane protein
VVERARLEGAAVAALLWVALLEAQELQRVRETAAADAAKLAKIADARATAGVVTGAERSLAQAEVGAARLALLDGEGRALEARLSLAHAMGQSLDSPLTAEGPIDSPILMSGYVRSPAIAAAEARAHQANAEARVAHATAGPTFFFGGTAWREGSGDKAAAAIVSVPLPFFDPGRYDTAKQNIIASAAAARAERLRVELEHQVRLAQHEREHTREVKKAVDESVLTPVRAALTTAMTAYAAGTGELSVVLLARRSAFAAEERAIAASAEVERADIKLAALNGTLVPR